MVLHIERDAIRCPRGVGFRFDLGSKCCSSLVDLREDEARPDRSRRRGRGRATNPNAGDPPPGLAGVWLCRACSGDRWRRSDGLMLAGELASTSPSSKRRRTGTSLARAQAVWTHARPVLDQRGIAERFLSEGQVGQVAGFSNLGSPLRLDRHGALADGRRARRSAPHPRRVEPRRSNGGGAEEGRAGSQPDAGSKCDKRRTRRTATNDEPRHRRIDRPLDRRPAGFDWSRRPLAQGVELSLREERHRAQAAQADQLLMPRLERQ